MPRILAGTLAADIATQFPHVAFTLEITLADGTTNGGRFTTHPFEQTVDGQLFKAAGMTLSRLEFGIGRRRASCEAVLSTGADSTITIADIERGLYRSATYQIGIYDYSAASPVKTVVLAGLVGRAGWDDAGLSAEFDLKGNLRRGQQIIVWKYTAPCKSSTGDDDCGIPIIEDPSVTHITVRADSTAYALGHHIRVFQAGSYNDRIFKCTVAGTSAGSAPSFDLTIDNTTVDGTATWTCEDAWLREATVATVVDLHKFTITYTEARAVDGWFGGFGEGYGLAIFRSGSNINRQMETMKWTNSTSEIQLRSPMPYAVQVGDTLELIPADNKTFTQCWAKFNWGDRFVGEPYKGPTDAVDIAPV